MLRYNKKLPVNLSALFLLVAVYENKEEVINEGEGKGRKKITPGCSMRLTVILASVPGCVGPLLVIAGDPHGG